MIRVDRNSVVAPPSLSRPATQGQFKGRTEERAIIEAYAAYLATQPPPAAKFDFPFKAYKGSDVKQALTQLFRGKCAYCEARYAGTQPMDVEHWRPKGGVQVIGANGKATLEDGYPWLAATWENLLPSCIDCNRPRIQHDALTGVDETLGKANQFPISGLRMKAPDPADATAPVPDVPLIIDPTAEDPAEHLQFHDDGTVLALTDKGTSSIRVYALNRADLAFERWGLAKLIEQRLSTIEALATVIANRHLPDDLRLDLQDLVSHEIDALLDLAEAGAAYSGMARQLIQEAGPLGLAVTPPTPLWAPDVAAMLDRIAARDASPDHLAVASRLAGLGFLANLPRTTGGGVSRSTYVRWTVTGTARSVVLYQDAHGLASDSNAQLAFAGTLGGAHLVPGTHPKVTFTYDRSALGAVLDAASEFRTWADRA